MLLVLGGLLMVGALISGLVRRSFLSLAALFVLTGFALGEGGLEVLDFGARSEFVHDLAIVALVVILFRDGLEVEAEMLQREWHLPFRKLALGMPITGAIVACAAHWIVGLDWLESALLGALLSPTDPVLSSSVVTNPRVPRLVRHSLNLESGLNDGLALPAVLAFTAALADEEGFVWWRFVLQDVTLGFAFGIVLAWIAAKLMPRGRKLTDSIPAHAQSLYALGRRVLDLRDRRRPAAGGQRLHRRLRGRDHARDPAARPARELREPGRRHRRDRQARDLRRLRRAADLRRAVRRRLGRGRASPPSCSWRPGRWRSGSRWPAPRVDTATKAFMAWFGPKGVATMTFSLFVLGEGVPGAELHLQPRGALRVRLRAPARADRHARVGVAR